MIYWNIYFFIRRLWKFSKVFRQGSICLPGNQSLLESGKAPLSTGKDPGPIALPVFSKISPVAYLNGRAWLLPSSVGHLYYQLSIAGVLRVQSVPNCRDIHPIQAQDSLQVLVALLEKGKLSCSSRFFVLFLWNPLDIGTSAVMENHKS